MKTGLSWNTLIDVEENEFSIEANKIPLDGVDDNVLLHGTIIVPTSEHRQLIEHTLNKGSDIFVQKSCSPVAVYVGVPQIERERIEEKSGKTQRERLRLENLGLNLRRPSWCRPQIRNQWKDGSVETGVVHCIRASSARWESVFAVE